MRSYVLILVLLVSISACSKRERMVAVAGQCLRSVSPDRGAVNLVAQVTDANGQTAAKKATELYEQIRAAVQKLNLKDLEMQTSEYSIHEMVDYPNNKRVSMGMRASIGLQVTTSEIARLGEVTALASQLPIERVEGLSTFLSREGTKKAQEECLNEAVANAQTKAVQLAQAAGAKVGEVLQIDETPGGHDRPHMEMHAMKASDSMGGGAPATIEAKREVINVNVLVKFALK